MNEDPMPQSEMILYQKVLDSYAASKDYAADSEISQQFFATVQNKRHWAAHGQTAAEVIHQRVDAELPFMGLQTTRPGGIICKGNGIREVSGLAGYFTPRGGCGFCKSDGEIEESAKAGGKR
jgi:hypothetical protein